MAANYPLRLDIIDSIMSILGVTKTAYWPFVENEGLTIVGHAGGPVLAASETAGAAEALEDDFNPMLHPGGVHTYDFHPTGDHHLAGGDDADYSHGDASADSAVSFGALIIPNDVGAARAIIAKYDSGGNTEEYKYGIASSGKMELELHDASASASEIGTADTALTRYRPAFVVVTYDGAQAAPKVLHYKNGALDSAVTGPTTETGAYVAMEGTAAPLTIGCAGVTATPTEEFHGRMGGPFMCGKELSQAEITALWHLYRDLYGLP
ncbi:hypothetical protein CMI37_14450 [Candidatus Pacearchaeota archaeon]|nr:hypothetical protein [Candidatus Pacearchaeota archaeon]|tara:strand:- start:1946 stop:2743 length:798 start_codon:yes stop_codon:yes gene_type:complete